jgi:hypothetical protein
MTVILAKQESCLDRIVQKSTLSMCFNISSNDLKMQIYYTTMENHPMSASVSADPNPLFDACTALLIGRIHLIELAQ